MPSKPKQSCNFPQCANYAIRSGYCQFHVSETQQYDKARPSAYRRGYGARWQKARKHYLAKHPLCVACQAVGNTTAANEVDHITPHEGDQGMFWDRDNWQALCKSCHSRKTASETNAKRAGAGAV